MHGFAKDKLKNSTLDNRVTCLTAVVKVDLTLGYQSRSGSWHRALGEGNQSDSSKMVHCEEGITHMSYVTPKITS